MRGRITGDPSRARSWIAALLVAGIAGTAASEAAAADGIAADRPRGTYVQVPTDRVRLRQPTAQGGGLHTIFLNRCIGGITITQGTDDSRSNVSSIVSGSISLPAYPFGDAAWNELVVGSQEMFAPFGIVVTDVDPSPAPHDEVIVCGSDNAAGFPGAAGVAPYTCGVIENVITYVFPETIGNDARFTIETIAQEAAHGWGLDHEFKCEDPMTYLLDCGDKSFQDGAYPCGEYEARACNCGGNDQNSFQRILEIFGPGTPDTQAPLVRIVQPMDGQQFAPGDDFPITVEASDDVEVQSVSLYVDGALLQTDPAPPFEGWSATDIPAGTHEFYVEALDAAGNLGLSDVVTIEASHGDDGADDEGTGGESDGGDGLDDGESDGGLDSGGLTGGSQGLPPGFSRGAAPEGCACAAGRRSGPATGLLLVGLGALVRRRRRS